MAHLLMRKEKDGVPYCVLNAEGLAVLRQGLDEQLWGAVPVYEELLPEYSEEMGADLPVGTHTLALNVSPPATQYIDQVAAEGQGLIWYETSRLSLFLPTDNLKLLRQINTCSQTQSGGGVVILEPAGGWQSSRPLLYVELALAAVGLAAIGYLAMRALRRG
jgi:hypothetical protein